MDIVEEIQKFKKQMEDLQRDNTLFVTLEKRYIIVIQIGTMN